MAERASLPEVLEACVDRRLEGLHTAAFGVIKFYADGLATVQPNLPDVAAHQSVPVLIPGAWDDGDPCLIVYCEREFTKGLEDAGEERRHGVGGPVAIPLIQRPDQSVDFVALAGLVNDQLLALADAIQATVIVPNDGGASFKSTLLSGLASWPGSVAAAKVKAR